MKDDNIDSPEGLAEPGAVCPGSLKILDQLKNLAVWRTLQDAHEQRGREQVGGRHRDRRRD